MHRYLVELDTGTPGEQPEITMNSLENWEVGEKVMVTIPVNLEMILGHRKFNLQEGEQVPGLVKNKIAISSIQFN